MSFRRNLLAMALLLRGAHLALVILSAHTKGQRNGCGGRVEDWVVQNRPQHGFPAVEERKRDKELTPQCDSSHSSGERTNKRERKRRNRNIFFYDQPWSLAPPDLSVASEGFLER